VSVTQLGYLGLSVRDVAAWERFASDFLGLQVWPDRGEDGTVYLRMDERHHRFMLTPSHDDRVFCTGWEVPNAQALAETVARLQTAGVKVTPGTEAEARKRRVWEFVKFDDPTGLSGELYYGAHVDHRPFRPGRAVSGFVTGPCGMGHLVVGVDRAAPVTAFYRDLLGFRHTDYIAWAEQKVDLTFLHCNPRHHSIAFVEGPHVQPGLLNHFMLETKSLDDVGRAYDLADAMGLHVIQALGRHSNDFATSFYVVNPSGFGVEYGWGAIQVTDESTWTIQHHTTGSIWGHQRRKDARTL
jgi:2,3-dihydroxybiphenyl 1,2-dioxygenase